MFFVGRHSDCLHVLRKADKLLKDRKSLPVYLYKVPLSFGGDVSW